MKLYREFRELAGQQLTRRAFVGRAGRSLGSVALVSLLNPALLCAQTAATSSRNTGAIHPPHHPAKIKRVIWLSMAGGPSQLETFDFKPQLARMDGQPMPESLTRGQQL